MLIAVLEQHAELRLADRDIFASSVGGMRIVEPASDLALLLAIAGAHFRRPMPARSIAVGRSGWAEKSARCRTWSSASARRRGWGAHAFLRRPRRARRACPASLGRRSSHCGPSMTRSRSLAEEPGLVCGVADPVPEAHSRQRQKGMNYGRFRPFGAGQKETRPGFHRGGSVVQRRLSFDSESSSAIRRGDGGPRPGRPGP